MLSISSMFSCLKRETQIYKLHDFSNCKEVDGITYYNEIFIVANPSRNKEKLLNMLSDFNNNTINEDIANEIIVSRKRTFYRETKDLNQNFKEKDPNKSGYFEKVDLASYHSDKLFVSRWTVSQKLTGYNTSFLNSKVGETEQFVKDL